MAENPQANPGDDNRVPSGATAQSGSKSMTANLPMVVAPKLGAGEDEPVEEEAGVGAAAAAEPAAGAHSSRFLVLAGLVAFAAAFGSFIGSVSGSGLVRILDPASPATATMPAVGLTSDAMRQMKLELSELAAIKANVDAVGRSTNAQIAKLSDRLDRLGQRAASVETTGSITPAPQPAPTLVPVKASDRVLSDWKVQDVEAGRALLLSRFGGMFDVGEGSTLPGVGRINAIKRQDGQWIVLTERGTITSGR